MNRLALLATTLSLLALGGMAVNAQPEAYETTGDADTATIAAGTFGGQEDVRLANLAYVASAASRHADLPLGMVYNEPLAVADLGDLPDGLSLEALYLAGEAALQVSDEEAAALRDFVEGGGFLIVDGSRAFRDSVRNALHIEEWDVEIRSLPADHPLFHDTTAYAIDAPALRGIYRGERLAGVITDVDLGAGWTNEANTDTTPEWMHGINLVIYLASK